MINGVRLVGFVIRQGSIRGQGDYVHAKSICSWTPRIEDAERYDVASSHVVNAIAKDRGGRVVRLVRRDPAPMRDPRRVSYAIRRGTVRGQGSYLVAFNELAYQWAPRKAAMRWGWDEHSKATTAAASILASRLGRIVRIIRKPKLLVGTSPPVREATPEEVEWAARHMPPSSPGVYIVPPVDPDAPAKAAFRVDQEVYESDKTFDDIDERAKRHWRDVAAAAIEAYRTTPMQPSWRKLYENAARERDAAKRELATMRRELEDSESFRNAFRDVFEKTRAALGGWETEQLFDTAARVVADERKATHRAAGAETALRLLLHAVEEAQKWERENAPGTPRDPRAPAAD